MTARMTRTESTTPAPAIHEKPKRRIFTKEYKRAVLQAVADAPPGQIGAVLRREGLYSSMLVKWRRELRAGSLAGMGTKKRGPKTDPRDAELEQLRRKLGRAEKRIEIAEKVIAAQKKVCELLRLPSDPDSEPSS